MTNHRVRLAKIRASMQDRGTFILLHKLPGMKCDEALRLWYGPDRGEWPKRHETIIGVVAGLDLVEVFGAMLADVDSEFCEHRGGIASYLSNFEPTWDRLVAAFDEYRRQVREEHGTGLMVRVNNNNDNPAKLYGPTPHPYRPPAPALAA